MYVHPEFQLILPGVTSLDEAQAIYYGFRGYKEKIAKHGIVAFHIANG